MQLNISNQPIMKIINQLKGDLIESVNTKFFYKLDKLCFRVVLAYQEGNSIWYQDFENFQDYQKNHQEVIAAIKGKSILQNNYLLLA